MSRNFLKIRNGLLLSGQTVAPSDPVNGDVYYDSTLNQFRFYQNGAWVTIGGTSGFSNGGNAFGGTATLGTTDNFNLNLITNGATRVTVGSSGTVTFTGILSSSNTGDSSTNASNSINTLGGISAAGTLYSGKVGTGTGGSVQLRDDAGVLRWKAGLDGTGGGTSYILYDFVANTQRFSINSSGNATFSGEVAATRFYSGDGTAGAPAVSFTSDTDTGLFKEGPDRIGFALGGNRHLDLGKIGSAGTYLQLRNSGSDVAWITTDAADSLLRLTPNNTTSSTSYIEIFGPSHASNPNQLRFYNAGAYSAGFAADGRLLFQPGKGLVGLDTVDGSDNQSLTLWSSPVGSVVRGAGISIYGNQHAAGVDGTIEYYTGNPAEATNARHVWFAGAVEKMRLSSAGNLTVRGDVTAGVASSVSGAFVSNTSAGSNALVMNMAGATEGRISATGASNLTFYTNTNERLAITSAGIFNFTTTEANFSASNPAAYNGLNIVNTNTTGFIALRLFSGTNGSNGTGLISYVPGTFFRLGLDANDTTTPLQFATSSALRMSIEPSSAETRWYGTTSGYFGLKPANTTTSYTLTLPTAAPSVNGQVLSSTTGGVASWTTVTATTAPSVQKFTSGSGTYTTPAGVLYIRVRMVGGGGGGAGSALSASANGGAAGTGGNTTFGSSLLAANGGTGGVGGGGGAGATPGNGGTASLGTGPIGTALTGSSGQLATPSLAGSYAVGGLGGTSPFGGTGSGGVGTLAGVVGAANTGVGGGGGGGNASSNGGGGGGSGGYVDALISSPSATYSYAVGAAGTAGAAGTSGFVGIAGAVGYIEVTEYRQ